MPESSIKSLISEKFGEKSIKSSQAEWRDAGGKIVGWSCTYVPEELIASAGMLPVRIFGQSTSTIKSESFIYSNLCPLLKNIVASAAEKKYDFDGIVVAETCDVMPKLHSVWEHFMPLDMHLLMAVPKTKGDHAVEYMVHEMSKVKEGLEKLSGTAISDDSLRESIVTQNKTRGLLRSLFELRKQEAPKINGSEALLIMKAAMSMPKDHFNNSLESVLPELESANGHSDFTARIAIAGGYLDRPYIAEAIEDGDGIVVVEDSCTSHRYFGLDDDVRLSADSDPLLALAQRYLNREPCSCMYTSSAQKLENTFRLYKEFQADGIIWHSLKFCDCSAMDVANYEEEFKERGIPLLHLETDYSDASLGQIKTRVEAFLETIDEEEF